MQNDKILWKIEKEIRRIKQIILGFKKRKMQYA